jgi:hypothetical protein
MSTEGRGADMADSGRSSFSFSDKLAAIRQGLAEADEDSALNIARGSREAEPDLKEVDLPPDWNAFSNQFNQFFFNYGR